MPDLHESEKNQMTSEGVRELEERLERLKTVERSQVAAEIKEARAYGDLSENAEYDAAKEKQAKIEGEIANLEKQLRNAVIVDEEGVDSQLINVGTYVKILDKETNEEEEYRIVSSAEADLARGKLSNESPVGASLLGKKAGATVKVEAPGGIVRYKVLEISKRPFGAAAGA